MHTATWKFERKKSQDMAQQTAQSKNVYYIWNLGLVVYP